MLPRLLSSLPQFAVWLCLSSLLSRSSLIRLRVLYSCSLRQAEREIDCSQFSCRLNCIDLSPIHADEELCYLLITTAIPSWHQWDGCTGVGEFIGPWGDALGCAGLFPDPSGPYERDSGCWGNPSNPVFSPVYSAYPWRSLPLGVTFIFHCGSQPFSRKWHSAKETAATGGIRVIPLSWAHLAGKAEDHLAEVTLRNVAPTLPAFVSAQRGAMCCCKLSLTAGWANLLISKSLGQIMNSQLEGEDLVLWLLLASRDQERLECIQLTPAENKMYMSDFHGATQASHPGFCFWLCPWACRLCRL